MSGCAKKGGGVFLSEGVALVGYRLEVSWK